MFVKPPPHETITPTKENVPFASTVSVYEFPVPSDKVHVPTISFAVPLGRLHVVPSFGHVMVVDVIVTPVIVVVPKSGPLHVKFELVTFKVITLVVEFQSYVPLAVYVPGTAVATKFLPVIFAPLTVAAELEGANV